MDNPDHLALCKRLFEATAAADGDGLRAVCSPDLAASQNGGPSMDLEGLIRFAAATASVAQNFRYTNVERRSTRDGFVEEHDVECDLAGGASLRMRVCVVGTVANGVVTQLREYADARAAGPLIAALSA